MNKIEKIGGTSTESIKKATGKGWEEWINLLDDVGAEKMTHKEIAQMIFDKGYCENSWWCQQIAVGWEKAKGKREVGQTKDSGYEIGVQGILPMSNITAWNFLLTPPGLHAWLGELPQSFKFEKGAEYRTRDGAKGQIRTFEDGKKLRLTYILPNSEQATTLQVYILPAAQEKTSVRFHQEKLKNSSQREEMHKHWSQVIKKLQNLAPKIPHAKVKE